MEDNQNTVAFIQWLAKSLDQDPETIMKSVEEAMKTEEGQQQIMQLYQKFEQEGQQNQMFRKGGKIDAFARKYQYGGNFYKRWTAGDIRKLQTFLAGHGYDPGDLDGVMGAKTIAAIKQYQKAHNLTQDGLWGTNTNKEQKVLSSDIVNKGTYRPTHSYERGTIQAYDNTPITTVEQIDPKTFQDLHVYYLNHPDEFFDETNQNASKFRQILHNSGKTGADIINQIYAGTNPEERRAISGKIKTGQINSDETKAAIYRAQGQVAPVIGGSLAAPVAIGTTLSAPLAVAAAYGGSGAGSIIGRIIGEDIAMNSKDKAIYHDATATNYGVGNITYDPERRIQESRDLGTIYGGIAGAALTGGGIKGLENILNKYKNGGELPLIKKAQKGDVIVPVKSSPDAAKRSAWWNAKNAPMEGIDKRQVGYSMDSKGGQYYYEDGIKNGNSFETYITVPQPGDTVVTQKVYGYGGDHNNTYPMGSDEYNSVMRRNRKNPIWAIMDAVRKTMNIK